MSRDSFRRQRRTRRKDGRCSPTSHHRRSRPCTAPPRCSRLLTSRPYKTKARSTRRKIFLRCCVPPWFVSATLLLDLDPRRLGERVAVLDGLGRHAEALGKFLRLHPVEVGLHHRK